MSMTRRSMLAALAAIPCAPAVTSADAVTVGRDEVLVITMPADYSEEAAFSLRAALEQAWPGREALLLSAGVTISSVPNFWGRVDAKRHKDLAAAGYHLRIYVDGKDETNACRFFDDTPGRREAEFFSRNADGQHYLVSGEGEYGEGKATRLPAIWRSHDFEIRQEAHRARD